eukprot:gene4604-biopygen5266
MPAITYQAPSCYKLQVEPAIRQPRTELLGVAVACGTPKREKDASPGLVFTLNLLHMGVNSLQLFGVLCVDSLRMLQVQRTSPAKDLGYTRSAGLIAAAAAVLRAQRGIPTVHL